MSGGMGERVTFVSYYLGAGGAERIMTVMANYWAGHGRSVTILTLDDGSVPPFFPLSPAVAHRPLGLAAPSVGAVTAVRNLTRRALELRRAIRATKPDIVIAFMDQTNVLTLLAMLGSGVPVVVSEHNDPYSIPLGRGWVWLRRALYPRAAAVTVLSERAREYFPPRLRRRIYVLPNPVVPPVGSGEQIARDVGKTIVAMGRLVEQKGFDLLLQAFAAVASHQPGWTLAIWGEGPLRGELEILRDSLGLAGRALLPGLTDAPGAVMQAGDIFALSSRHEGFPTVLCEALVCGLPVVSFDCPSGPREIVRDGVDGVLVPDGDVGAFAGALAELMGDAALRARLASRGTEILRRFGVDAVMGMWETLLRDVGPQPGAIRTQSAGRKGGSMIRVFLLIRALDIGGAERQIIEVAKGLDKTRFDVTLATFYDGGALRPEIEHVPGVRVISLGKRHRWDIGPFMWHLWREARAARPDVMQGIMSIPNELCLLVGRPLGARVGWALQASDLDLARMGGNRIDELIFALSAWLSRFADLIISNSYSGKRYHVAKGFRGDRMVVIPNGFDTARFRPDRSLGQRLRDEWGVGEGEHLIGIVGRLDPMKDHPTFLRAAARLAATRGDIRFVCVGDGPGHYRDSLRALATDLGLRERLVWAGPRTDMPAVYNALDIATSSSAYGEGIANVLGEAMACGIPCVVTDVGDSAIVVADTGHIVPPRDPAALAAAWDSFLNMPEWRQQAQREAARERVVRKFSLERLVQTTEECFAALARM